MRILVTGSAGFIGSALSIRLLSQGNTVVGIDCHNDYYDPELKEARLSRHVDHTNYTHVRINLKDRVDLAKLFNDLEFDVVVNLAAQAGVRYSLENPMEYIDSNIVGFGNLLECCRHHKIKHLVYASSSSTYGLNTKQPFSPHNSTNHPVSLYAATKKANELMAHSYSHLFNIPTTGLRFFTVYGPYDRPDMALQKFTSSILAGEPIKVFNHGKHKRDFTYIDDIVEGIVRVIERPAKINPLWDSNNPDPASSNCPYRVYNIGNHNPVELLEFIEALEDALEIKAEKLFLPIQPGDVPETFAYVDDFIEDFGYKPKMKVKQGVENFVKWYKEYNNV